jgi:predicted HicB family RNase H-like nuclease
MAAHKNNQYAAKHKGYDAKLHVEIVKSEKLAYKAHAEAEGSNLTTWVNQALREQYKRDNEV